MRGAAVRRGDRSGVVVAVQMLDGITAAVLGVMVPLMVADVTRGTGRFNLAHGVVGTRSGIGASMSTTLAGYMTDYFGSQRRILRARSDRGAGLAAVLLLMPETRPRAVRNSLRPAGRRTVRRRPLRIRTAAATGDFARRRPASGAVRARSIRLR